LAELDNEDRKFLENVIERNKDGLTRLAKEEDAKEKRYSLIRLKLKDFYRKLTGSKDEKKFMKIEMN
jgi:5-hydroxyisourate hydrolase-like protein (transthyretin family)